MRFWAGKCRKLQTCPARSFLVSRCRDNSFNQLLQQSENVNGIVIESAPIGIEDSDRKFVRFWNLCYNL